MTAKDRPARHWLGLAEILLIHAVLLAILIFVIWESVTQLGAQDRTLPLTIAVIVGGTLLYSLVARLRATPDGPAREQLVAEAGAPATMGDAYGAIATDALTPRHAYAIIAFTLYVLITPRLSIYLATALFVIALSLALRVPWIAATAGLVLALVIPALFQFGLEMRLP
jgi:hypothetical protein